MALILRQGPQRYGPEPTRGRCVSERSGTARKFGSLSRIQVGWGDGRGMEVWLAVSSPLGCPGANALPLAYALPAPDAPRSRIGMTFAGR